MNIGKRKQQMNNHPEIPTHFCLFRESVPESPMVKEAGFFISQGGLKEDWGKHWEPVYDCETVGDARRKFAESKGVKLSHIYWSEK